MQVITPDGATADDTVQRPMPALLWYPPAHWQPGETIVTTSMPWYLPRAWAPVLTVTAGGEALPARITPSSSERAADRPATAAIDGRVQLPAWERREGPLRPYASPSDPRETASARFENEDWRVALTHWAAPIAVAPGDKLVREHTLAGCQPRVDRLQPVRPSARRKRPDRGHRRRSAELVCAAPDFAMAWW